eukprot:m.25167 g.25167  ORF g.25167 m.25167 type:complete len:711 (-) comp11422_c0_seq2:25-2157(-)
MGDADGADDAGAAPHAAHLVRPGQRGENEGESAQGEPIGMWAMTLCTPTTATRTTSADGVPLRAVLAALVGIGFEVDVDAEMQDLLTAGLISEDEAGVARMVSSYTVSRTLADVFAYEERLDPALSSARPSESPYTAVAAAILQPAPFAAPARRATLDPESAENVDDSADDDDSDDSNSEAVMWDPYTENKRQSMLTAIEILAAAIAAILGKPEGTVDRYKADFEMLAGSAGVLIRRYTAVCPEKECPWGFRSLNLLATVVATEEIVRSAGPLGRIDWSDRVADLARLELSVRAGGVFGKGAPGGHPHRSVSTGRADGSTRAASSHKQGGRARLLSTDSGSTCAPRVCRQQTCPTPLFVAACSPCAAVRTTRRHRSVWVTARCTLAKHPTRPDAEFEPRQVGHTVAPVDPSERSSRPHNLLRGNHRGEQVEGPESPRALLLRAHGRVPTNKHPRGPREHLKVGFVSIHSPLGFAKDRGDRGGQDLDRGEHALPLVFRVWIPHHRLAVAVVRVVVVRRVIDVLSAFGVQSGAASWGSKWCWLEDGRRDCSVWGLAGSRRAQGWVQPFLVGKDVGECARHRVRRHHPCNTSLILADQPSGEQVLHLGVHIYLEANPNKGSQDRPKRDTISRCSAGRGGWGAQCHGPHPDGFALGRFALVLSPLTWTDQVGSMGSCPGIVRTVRVTHCALTWSNSPPSRPPRPELFLNPGYPS